MRSLIVKPVMARRFEVATCGDERCVVDGADGRPVSLGVARPAAEALAAQLNVAAAKGPKALSVALETCLDSA